ncbi:hypothetical protein GEMRC1_011855 [Eukaryota sp. GEM-RC1]
MIIRTPSRVNIIGEHVDYSHFQVLPFAINRYFTAEVKKTESNTIHITINNQTFDISLDDPNNLSNSPITCSKPNLASYAICALKGIHHLQSSPLTSSGLNVTCHSTIPIASGLSSSSAIVVSFMLIFNYFFLSQPITDRMVLAELTRKAEQFCGTLSGGMDQAVILNAKRSHYSYISFSPLRCHSNLLPSCVKFIVAHSLEECHKAESKDLKYNLRVVEMRMACVFVAKFLNLDDIFEILSLRDVFYAGEVYEASAMIEVLQSAIPQRPLSLLEISEMLNISTDIIQSKILKNAFATSTNPFDIYYKPFKRALHVVTEFQRVMEFDHLSSLGGDNLNICTVLGKLLNQSQDSLRDNYECSSPNIDLLLSVMLGHPSVLGGRLTGAGFGGNCIAMVKESDVDDVMDYVWKEFYLKRYVDPSQRNDLLFVAESVDAAEVSFSDE